MALVHDRGFVGQVFAESAWYLWLEPALSAATLLCSRDSTRAGSFPTPEAWSALYRQTFPSSEALRFVAAPAKKVRRGLRREPIALAELYEGRIVERGEVPTRLDDWHDFFNVLAFFAFPAAKRALHLRQYHCHKARLKPDARRLPGARTREQDALSLLDEGGVLVAVREDVARRLPCEPDAFQKALLPLLVSGAARAVPFGHALFEHLVLGRADMLGTLIVVPVGGATPAVRAGDSETGVLWRDRIALRTALDGALAAMLSDKAQFLEPNRLRGMALRELSP